MMLHSPTERKKSPWEVYDRQKKLRHREAPRIDRRRFISTLGVAALAARRPASWAKPQSPPASRLPNIVIIYTDDQGYADVGVFGAEDSRLRISIAWRAEGRRFTNFYVAQPVCSASRAALLAGCYPNRVGVLGALGPKDTHGISDGEVRSRNSSSPGAMPLRSSESGIWDITRSFFQRGTALTSTSAFRIPMTCGPSPESPKGYPPLPLIEGEDH